MATQVEAHPHPRPDRYCFFVDDREFRTHKPELTGGEIMDIADVPRDVGLLLILKDGSQRPVRADEVIDLGPGCQFKRSPRFKRGFR